MGGEQHTSCKAVVVVVVVEMHTCRDTRTWPSLFAQSTAAWSSTTAGSIDIVGACETTCLGCSTAAGS